MKPSNILNTSLILLLAVSVTSCKYRTRKNFHSTDGLSVSAGPGGLGEAPADPSPDASDGTVGVMNFSNAARFYKGTVLSRTTTMTAFNSVIAAAQTALPVGNKALELQAPAQVMAIQQLANAACKDMPTAEASLAAGSRSFLGAMVLTGGPSSVRQADLDAYFNNLSMVFVGAPASQQTLNILTEGYQAAASAALGIPTLAGKPANQTLAALQIPCAALGSSPRAIKQ